MSLFVMYGPSYKSAEQSANSTITVYTLHFFWDHLHWILQSVLFLPQEEGGQGLTHLASRGTAFHLQFIQRFLTAPADPVWRPLAESILGQCGAFGLAKSLFLMALSKHKLDDLPCGSTVWSAALASHLKVMSVRFIGHMPTN